MLNWIYTKCIRAYQELKNRNTNLHTSQFYTTSLSGMLPYDDDQHGQTTGLLVQDKREVIPLRVRGAFCGTPWVAVRSSPNLVSPEVCWELGSPVKLYDK